MYRALVHDPGACVLLAGDGGEGGYAAGTLALRETEKAVQRALSRRRSLALRMAYRNLLAPWHVAARLAWERTIPRSGIGYVLTIGATPGSPTRGMALLAALERDFVARGARESWVDTEGSNEKALRFYDRHGYSVVSRRCGQVLLRKPLVGS